MKKIMILLLFVLTCEVSFTQNIEISVAPRGDTETIRWELSYNSFGMITAYMKYMISTGEVLESLTVTKTDNGFLSDYKVKALTVVNQIECKKNDLAITSRLKNSLTGSDKTSERSVTKIANEIIDVVNGFTIYKYDIQKKKLFDCDNQIISERQENIIYNDGDIITIFIRPEYIELKVLKNPAIVPASIIKIRGDVNKLQKSLIINYSLIPYELQFLLLLM